MSGENKRKVGSSYEKQAAEYLKERGYQILTQNYRCRIGEIDLIARDGRYLVFIEVKYRQDAKTGMPQEAVDYRKQVVISKVAAYYCMVHHYREDTPCRFDVVAICGDEVTLIRNAFAYIGG